MTEAQTSVQLDATCHAEHAAHAELSDGVQDAEQLNASCHAELAAVKKAELARRSSPAQHEPANEA